MSARKYSHALMQRFYLAALPTLVATACLVALLFWWQPFELSDEEKVARLPIDHPRPEALSKESADYNPGTLVPGEGQPADLPGSWPWFRGMGRDNVARDDTPLLTNWPEGGPPVLWKVIVGEGHAGPVVQGGRVYLLDYDRERSEDAIRCFALSDGSEIWRYTYSVEVKRNHGMSRTTPAVSDGYLLTLGPKCHVHCLDAQTGERVWRLNLVEACGTIVPPWYAGQCPVIDSGRAILAPGASPLMMALDLATGNLLWKTSAEYDGMGMTHSSIRPITFAGKRQYVYCSGQGVVSVDAESGKVLWTWPAWKIGIANIPTPVWLGDGRIFFTGGYNKGSLMLELQEQDGVIVPRESFQLPARTFGSDQQTPIFYAGHLYGVGASPDELVCLSPDGQILWTSGGDRRFGLGPYLVVQGHLLVLDDQSCTLHLAKASPLGYNEVSRAKMLDGHDAWAPMAWAEGRLLLRDLTQLICLDLRARP